jgi:hypothetical protein
MRAHSTSTRLFVVLAVVTLLAGVASAQVADKFITSPDHVAASPAGCRNNGGITLPDGGGFFICHPDTPNVPSTDIYTGGNLGKNWAELDLVPFRLTTSRSSSSTTPTYNVIIAGDNIQNNTKGYDFISVPIIDPNEDGGTPSDASCTVADANAGDVNSGLETVTGVTGGTDTTIYRTLTISQGPNTTCYFAYYQRLAIGAHLFSGSNLQAYIFTSADFKVGKQTIPIPVKKCTTSGCQPAPAPQTIDKTMTATSGESINWSLAGSGPNSISSNTCDPTQLTKSGLQFTISWSAVTTGASGVTIVTKVYATNPAASPVSATVTDYIYPGTDPTLDNDPTGLINPPGTNAALSTFSNPLPVVVPANSTGVLVLTHTYTDSGGTVGTGYNDIAVATYTDAAGNPVQGNTWAQASASATAGTAGNTSATINNQEDITGTGLNFSTDLVTPNTSGSFDLSYPSGTFPNDEVPLNFANPVSWTSNPQDATTVETDGGESVVFSKSVYFPSAVAVVGSLTDTATLTDSASNVVTMNPSLNVGITAAPLVSLEIIKNINVAVSTDQTFAFVLTDSQNNQTPASVTIPKGLTTANTTVMGLIADSYTVSENPATGWTTAASQTINLAPDPNNGGAVSCTGNSLTFNNTIVNADLTVSKTATPAFTRTYTWGISKAVDQTAIDTNGAGATFTYTVNVTHDSGTDSAWQVTGTITVTNPNSNDFTEVNVADSISNGVAGSCTVTGGANATIPAGASVPFAYTCTYASAPSPTTFTNTATASWSQSTYGTPDASQSGTATGDFSTTTPTLVDDSVTVTDPLDPSSPRTLSYTATSPITYKYSHTFTGDPSGTCTSHNNTATFKTDTSGTMGSDSKTVSVCVGADLTVSKTATTTVPTYAWTLTKSVSPNGTVEQSGSTTLKYTVVASYTVTGSWTVSGTITVSNPNNWEDITGVTISDKIDNNGTCTVTSGTNVTVPKSGSVMRNYTCTYTAAPTAGTTNTATATWTAATFFTPDGTNSGTAAYSFAATNGPTTVTITDAFNGGAPTTLGVINALTNTVTSLGSGVTLTSAPPKFTFTYSHVVNITAGTCGSIPNTATITGTGLSSSVTVTVTVCNTKTGALTMGFWQGPNGQKVIGTSKTAGSCTGTGAVIPYLQQFAEFSDLTATTCSALNSYVSSVVNIANSSGGGGLMVKGQMLALALTAYYSAMVPNPLASQGTAANIGSILILLDPIKGTEDVRSAFINYNKVAPHLWGEAVSQMLLDASTNWKASGCSATKGTCTAAPYNSKTIMVYVSDAFADINQGQANIAP